VGANAAIPVVDYIKRLRKDPPRDVINVCIPEYVVGRWWENLLHNQSSLRLKGRLLFEPAVMATSVPGSSGRPNTATCPATRTARRNPQGHRKSRRRAQCR
jgi:hypothetical protein